MKERVHKNEYALITGATGGLGKAFVHAIAKRGYSLLLTGRSEEKLQALQTELQKKYPDISIRLYAADLSSDSSRVAMMEKISSDDIRISFLVIVAGSDIQKGLSAYTQ